MLVNSFRAELFKVDSTMLTIGHLYSHVIRVLEYIDYLKANNAGLRWDISFYKSLNIAIGAERVIKSYTKTTFLTISISNLNADSSWCMYAFCTHCGKKGNCSWSFQIYPETKTLWKSDVKHNLKNAYTKFGNRSRHQHRRRQKRKLNRWNSFS